MSTLSSLISSSLDAARADPHGRYADLLVSDGPLRQTLIALRGGAHLAEHNSPPAASVLVLEGHIAIVGEDPSELKRGDLKALTHDRHGVEAQEDSVFLLTTVTSVPGTTSYGSADAL